MLSQQKGRRRINEDKLGLGELERTYKAKDVKVKLGVKDEDV